MLKPIKVLDLNVIKVPEYDFENYSLFKILDNPQYVNRYMLQDELDHEIHFVTEENFSDKSGRIYFETVATDPIPSIFIPIDNMLIPVRDVMIGYLKVSVYGDKVKIEEPKHILII